MVNDMEWPMLSYYAIYYEKFKKKSHAANRESSFNSTQSYPSLLNAMDYTSLDKSYTSVIIRGCVLELTYW